MARMKSRGAAFVVGAALVYLGFVATSFAQTTTYSYDVFGRLSSVSTSGGATSTYVYDAADNRTQAVKTTGAQVIGAATSRKGRRLTQFSVGGKRTPTALASPGLIALASASARR